MQEAIATPLKAPKTARRSSASPKTRFTAGQDLYWRQGRFDGFVAIAKVGRKYITLSDREKLSYETFLVNGHWHTNYRSYWLSKDEYEEDMAK